MNKTDIKTKFYRISTLGDYNNSKLAIVDSLPDGLGSEYLKISMGGRIGDVYPEEAKVYLDKSEKGIKLSSLLGNTEGALLVKSDFKNEIIKMCPGEQIEALPFTLFDHKDRPMSQDYWIINPLIIVDCLDENKSEIEYNNGEIFKVNRIVVDHKKIDGVGHLFRIQNCDGKYIASQDLINIIKEKKFSNVFVDELAVSSE